MDTILVTDSEENREPSYCENDKNISKLHNLAFLPSSSPASISYNFFHKANTTPKMGQPRFSWHLLPDVFEFWEELTLIVEAFLKELLNTVNISVKIPVKKTNAQKQESK